MSNPDITVAMLNERGTGRLPGHLGIVITAVGDGQLTAELPVLPHLLAPNGYLHAGSVVTLADTASGYGCIVNLPEGASNFTTIELKSNHLGTAPRRHAHLHGESRAQGPQHASVGCRGEKQGNGQDHRPVSLHANDSVSKVR